MRETGLADDGCMAGNWTGGTRAFSRGAAGHPCPPGYWSGYQNGAAFQSGLTVLFFSFLLYTMYFVPGPRRYAPPFGHSWVLKSQVLTAMKFWQCEPTQ